MEKVKFCFIKQKRPKEGEYFCGDGGNRIPVQKVVAKKSTYVARLLF